jgi:hypothetical protein
MNRNRLINGLNAISQRLTRPPIGEVVEASQSGDPVLLVSLLGIVRDGWALALITKAGGTRLSRSSGGVDGHIWHPVSILKATSLSVAKATVIVVTIGLLYVRTVRGSNDCRIVDA